MTRFVLDASVAAKWVLPSRDETLVPEALQLLQGYADGKIELSVPDLFWPEIGNILWKAARTGRIGKNTVVDGIRYLRELEIPVTPTGPLLANAAQIALTYDRTVYDSIYVAMAIVCGSRLVTADERLVHAVGLQLPVIWLGGLHSD